MKTEFEEAEMGLIQQQIAELEEWLADPETDSDDRRYAIYTLADLNEMLEELIR